MSSGRSATVSLRRILPGVIGVVLFAMALPVGSYAQGGTEPVPQEDPGFNLSAPKQNGLQLGLYVAGELAPNSAEFVSLPGMISCQGDTILYTGATGAGFAVEGVVGMRPTGTDGIDAHLGWHVKVGLSMNSSTFETDERIGQSISPAGELSDVVSRYSVDASLLSILIEPTISYRISSSTPIDFSLSPMINILAGGNYDQAESIVSPNGASYSDGRTERNVRSGSIENRNSLLYGATVGLSYEIAPSPTLAIRPEISASFGLNGPAADTEWKQNLIRLGVSFLFSPGARESTPLSPNR